jgi:hypothetical protein
MKLLIFVYTCAAYEKTRALLLQNSWAKDRPEVVFVTDNPNSQLKNTVYLGEYKKGFTYDPNIVKKIFDVWLTMQYDYYMIIDDDSYVYIDKLKDYLSFFDPANAYMIGDYLNWPQFNRHYLHNDYSKWIGGGSGIVFTKPTLIKLKNIYTSIYIGHKNHDCWLSDMLKYDKNIQPIHAPGFFQYPNGLNFDNDSKYIISIHLNHDMSLIEKYHAV